VRHTTIPTAARRVGPVLGFLALLLAAGACSSPAVTTTTTATPPPSSTSTTAAATTTAPTTVAAPSTTAAPKDTGMPGLVGHDHTGVTVRDVREAERWFRRILGCRVVLRSGPVYDDHFTLMRDFLGVDPRAVIDEVSMLRCGNGSNVDLFQYEAPDQDTTNPKLSDYGGHHLAFYVEDLDAAVAYLDTKGVDRLLGPYAVTDGPAAGRRIGYVRTPWGDYVELVSYPDGMVYEATSDVRPWSPKDHPPAESSGGVPGMLGQDHTGITVPDLAAAEGWFTHVLGCRVAFRSGPLRDDEGTFMHDLLDVDPRAVVDGISMLRCGTGSGIEVSQYEAPDQDTTNPKLSDYGGHYLAFYVEDIDAAVAYLDTKGVDRFLGPLPIADGPTAGESSIVLRAPWGDYLQLISYPDGMAYEADARVRLWDPTTPDE